MRRSIALLIIAAAPCLAFAQPAPPPEAGPPAPGTPILLDPKTGAPATPKSAIVATLPTPDLPPDATAIDFLRAARGAMAAGRTGEARSALEMAQTRLLSRAVDAGQERTPDDNVAVKQIAEAIAALQANDRMASLRYIEFASTTLGTPLD